MSLITADGTTPVVTAAPLDLSAVQGAAAPALVPLAVPAPLEPGYYVAVSSDYALSAATCSWIVQVTAT